MPYSLKQAADATGRTKTTVLRAIQKGKISATKDAHGEWEIDPAELHRVYEPASLNASEARTAHAPIASIANGSAHREIALLREMLADRNAVIEDLREDRDRWRIQAEKLLLTDQRAKTAPDVIVTPPPTSNMINTTPTATPPTAAPTAPAAASLAPVVKAPVVKVRKPPAKEETSWLRKLIGGK